MPNIKSNKKHLRKSVRRQFFNRAVKSRIKTVESKIIRLLGEAKFEDAKTSLNYFYKIADKASGKKVLKKNTVSRKKSKLAKKFIKIKQSSE